MMRGGGRRKFVLAAGAAAAVAGFAGGFLWRHRPRPDEHAERAVDGEAPARRDAAFPNPLRIPDSSGVMGVIDVTAPLTIVAKIALLAAALSCGSVFAETGANGGLVRDAGPYRIELVVKPRRTVLETPIVLFVTDRDGKPVETSGARGHADFSSGGLKGRATLHPDAANRMKGYGLMSAKSDLRIDVSISVSGQAPQHARFEPLANRGRQ